MRLLYAIRLPLGNSGVRPPHFDVQALAAIRHGGLRAHIERAGETIYRKPAPAAAGSD